MAAPLRRRLLRTALECLVIGAALGVLFSLRDPSPARIAIQGGISLLYALSIGIPATLIFGRLKPRIGRPALRQWVVYLGILTAIVLVASLFVGLVLVGVGLVELSRLWQVYRQGLVISLVVSFPVTLGAATMSRLQDTLHRTEHDKQRALALAAEARLASLESRVRPHFLFNALNSAIALIADEPRRAEAVLERLSGLLRASLDARARLVPLADELAIVTDYLEIEQVRFGDRLRYEIDVADELRALEVPPFAVQTLVENSVKFAVSPRTQGARIRVHGRRDGDRIVLEVADDGAGFTGEVWKPGHGLDGLRARLAAIYGPRARLIAPAEAEAGAAVRLEIDAGRGAEPAEP